MDLCVLIMAGGHGTRFWPWSSELLPKQFLPMSQRAQSLLQETWERTEPLCGPEKTFVLTNREYVPIVRAQLPRIPAANVIGEPVMRDTAAAVGLGCAVAASRFPKAIQIVLPADHEIAPGVRFREVLSYAARCAAEDGRLYTVGIKPSHPTSAYGYLRRGNPSESPAGFLRYEVSAFVEKPDSLTAKGYVESGEYDWNAGIFIWRPEAIARAIGRCLPVHSAILPALAAAFDTPAFESAAHAAFLKLPKTSIDFGVMQSEGGAGNVRAVEGDFHWSDVGGWTAFAERVDGDDHGNRVFGHAQDWNEGAWSERWSPRRPRVGDKDEALSLGEVFTMGASDNFVFNNRKGHCVVLFGVDNLSVIHTHRSTLITTRTQAELLKDLVSHLPDTPRPGGRVHVERVEKPWGWELWWGWTDDFAGKTLFLRRGCRLSLQYHVVKEEVIYLHQGRAILETAPRGGELLRSELHEGEAIHIEPGRLHRLEAIEDCLLFEASTPFLWDVVRVADDFGREGTRAAEAPGLDTTIAVPPTPAGRVRGRENPTMGADPMASVELRPILAVPRDKR